MTQTLTEQAIEPAVRAWTRLLRAYALTTRLLSAELQEAHGLTINPGLRYEHQHLAGTVSDLSLGNEWAPRIGATWDPTNRDKMKVYGSWG